MVIHFVRITTHLTREEVRQIMEERAPRFRDAPGLLQKYYGYEPESGAFCGCYLSDSEESRQAFRQSELARTIPVAYQSDEVRRSTRSSCRYTKHPYPRNEPDASDKGLFTKCRGSDVLQRSDPTSLITASP